MYEQEVYQLKNQLSYLCCFKGFKVDKSEENKDIIMFIPKEAAVFPIRTAMPVAVKKEFAS